MVFFIYHNADGAICVQENAAAGLVPVEVWRDEAASEEHGSFGVAYAVALFELPLLTLVSKWRVDKHGPHRGLDLLQLGARASVWKGEAGDVAHDSRARAKDDVVFGRVAHEPKGHLVLAEDDIEPGVEFLAGRLDFPHWRPP